MGKIKDFFKKPKEAEKKQEEEKQENLSVQFDLSADKQQDVIDYIKHRQKDFSDSRWGILDKVQRAIRLYEGIRPEKILPYPGCSNSTSMVATIASDLLHSKIFSMVWNEKAITWEGIDEHDVEVAELNKKVMSWVVSTDISMQDTVDDIVQSLIVEGTIAIKKVWKPYWVYVTRKIPKEITLEAIMNERLEYDIQYDYIRRERVFLERRPLEYVYFPIDGDTTQRNWEDETDIIDERWYTLSELREMQLDGVISDKVNLDNVKTKLMELTDTPKSTISARQEAEESTPTNTMVEFQKIRCFEAEIMYDVNDDGRRERCVFLISTDPDIWLGGKPLHAVSRIGRSSWVIRPFLRRPGRAFGKGIPELVEPLSNLLDAGRNQRIDAGNMVIAPPFGYRAASGTNPRRIIMRPATGIPLDDVDRDLKFFQNSTAGIQVSFQEEKLLLETIERLTYLTPAMLGKETAERPTARGTLAVIQQGEQKFGLVGARVMKIVCDLTTDIRQMYEENMPPEKWARILGREGVREYPSPEAMSGQYEAKMQLDFTALSADSDRQLAIMTYQTMGMDPFVMQNPTFMWEIRADYLKAMHREPVEKYIGPRPEMGVNIQDIQDIIAFIEQEMQPEGMGLEKIDPSTVIPKLLEFKRSERYQAMTPEAKAILERVLRELKLNYIDNIRKGVMLNAQGTQNAGGAQEFPGSAGGLRGLTGAGGGSVGGGKVLPGQPSGEGQGVPAGQ